MSADGSASARIERELRQELKLREDENIGLRAGFDGSVTALVGAKAAHGSTAQLVDLVMKRYHDLKSDHDILAASHIQLLERVATLEKAIET